METLRLSILLFVMFSSLHSVYCEKSLVHPKPYPDTTMKCDLTENIPQFMEVINKDVNAFYKDNDTNDNCLLALLDSLTERYVKNSSLEYLGCLEILWANSDGYVAEYFAGEVGECMFMRAFQTSFNYIYERRNKTENKLQELFIQTFGEKIQDYNNEQELRNFFNKQIDLYSFDKKRKIYFKKLWEKVNIYVKETK